MRIGDLNLLEKLETLSIKIFKFLGSLHKQENKMAYDFHGGETVSLLYGKTQTICMRCFPYLISFSMSSTPAL